MKIYITSAESGPGAWTGLERKLKYLHSISDQQHQLVDRPEAADLILVGDVREQEGWGRRIVSTPIFSEYPETSFAVSMDDLPFYLHHGVYEGGARNLLTWGRVVTGSYIFQGKIHQNPYVKKHYHDRTVIKNRKYLFSFKGGDNHRVRRRLFEQKFTRSDILIIDSSIFNLWATDPHPDKDHLQREFCDLILNSKFSLCPRGVGVNSVRLFESMQLGVAPIILSNAFLFPKGPAWSEFSIVVRENQVERLEEIVSIYEPYYEEMGRKARQAYDDYFSEPVYFNYLIDRCLEIKKTQRIPEDWYWKARYLIVAAFWIKDRVRLRGRIRNLAAKIRKK